MLKRKNEFKEEKGLKNKARLLTFKNMPKDFKKENEDKGGGFLGGLLKVLAIW